MQYLRVAFRDIPDGMYTQSSQLSSCCAPYIKQTRSRQWPDFLSVVLLRKSRDRVWFLIIGPELCEKLISGHSNTYNDNKEGSKRPCHPKDSLPAVKKMPAAICRCRQSDPARYTVVNVCHLQSMNN